MKSEHLLYRILRRCKQSILNPTIVDNIRTPFIELPRHIFLNDESMQSYDIIFGLGYRFSGQSDFIIENYTISNSIERFTLLSHSLSLTKNPLSIHKYCTSGLRSLINKRCIFVECITYCNGMYGRFMIMVSLGIGCTVWYGLVPGIPQINPTHEIFTPIFTYSDFLNGDYYPQGFRKISFIEDKDLLTTVTAAAYEKPFSDIQIPANGPIFQAVSLGIMIAIFITVGFIDTMTIQELVV